MRHEAQRVGDVGDAEDREAAGQPQPHRAAAQPARGQQPADRRDEQQVADRERGADQHLAEVALDARHHRVQDHGQRRRRAGGAERAVEPERLRGRPLVAAQQADHRRHRAGVEREEGDVRHRGDGRIWLDRRPRDVDDIPDGERQDPEPEPRRRSPPRPSEDRPRQACEGRAEHRDRRDPAVPQRVIAGLAPQ